MHDHVLTFKCDLDILGTANSFLKHTLVPAQVTYPWSTETRSTMQLQKETVANEDQGKLNWPDNGSGMFVVANVEKPNAFGESPGFLIKPSQGGAGTYLTVQNSSNLKEAGHFTSNHLFVAQRRDTEPFASHSDNSNDPGNPIVNFNDFSNSEGLEQQDLVLWFNLGMG
ncbi:copper amine oxidase [Leucosporidium creatinivorum]|uniref:Amine oxidase n=1 Tax=Leucosporidium creatinivorum TaxID=106004 RepID=A0A1Y2EMU8_9BASI|nr:copper amine oxidase [Leucosporidium creatinivorum]